MLEEQADKLVEEMSGIKVAIRETLASNVPGSRPGTRHHVNVAAGLYLVAQALERIGAGLERLADVAEKAIQ